MDVFVEKDGKARPDDVDGAGRAGVDDDVRDEGGAGRKAGWRRVVLSM